MVAKKLAFSVLNIGISAALLGYLLWQASRSDVLAELSRPDPPKNWMLLGVGWFANLTAITLNIFRWRVLVRAQGINLGVRDALRIGYLSYFVGLVGGGLGVVGGDAVKVVFLAHKYPGSKTAAAATVVVDRLIGLLALIVLAAAASFFLDWRQLQFASAADRAMMERLVLLVQVSAACGLIGGAVILLPGFTHSRLWDALAHVPKIGKVLERMVAAVRIYRNQSGKLLWLFLLSIFVHILLTSSLFCVAEGLALNRPPFGLYFVIGPIAFVTGALPVGVFEVTLKVLYQVSAAGVDQEGLITALGHRLLQTGVAAIGLVIYLATRAESAALIQEGQKEDEK